MRRETAVRSGYWVLTGVLALELAAGAAWDLTRRANVVAVVTKLGYPAYLLPILGIWKGLAAVAVLAPGRKRLKEWAYAGIVFEMSGAAVSQAIAGSRGELALTLGITALALGSWVLRPASRRFE
jgi:hypothetical protein